MASNLNSVIIKAPGKRGLNLIDSVAITQPEWSRISQNVIFDEASCVCARKGFTATISTAMTGSPEIQAMNLLDTTSGKKLIAAAEVSSSHKLYAATGTGYTSWTDVTGALTPSGSNWQLVTFNQSMLGAQAGETLIAMPYAGPFVTVSGTGTIPSGNCVHSAFGRVWAQKDSTTNQHIVSYSALLDHTDWSSGGGGGEISALGTASAIATGWDTMTAISSISRYLVVFFRNSIILYGAPDDPTNITIQKVIQGIGCVARDSVQQVGDDLIFLAADGIRSLREVITAETELELTTRSDSIQTSLVDDLIIDGDTTKIKSVFSPEEAQYWIKSSNNTIWVMDFRKGLEATYGQSSQRWTTFTETNWQAFAYNDGDLFLGTNGLAGTYSGYTDNGSSYQARWMSSWVDFQDNRLKIIKKFRGIVEGEFGQQVAFLWETDYGKESGSTVVTIPSTGTVAEWALAEWGLGEFSAGETTEVFSVPASKSGSVVSFGFAMTINGADACIKQLGLFAKIGREDR